MALRTAQSALATAAALAVPALAAAHPGHGLDPSASSWLHVVAEPEHALPLIGALCAAALVWGLRALRRRPN
jgi:hypothetical protein